MADHTSHVAQSEALADMYDSLERFAATDGACDTMAARNALWDATRALHRLALRAGESRLGTLVEALEKSHGL